MNDDQDTIFFLPGDSLDAIKNSPLLKRYEKENIEVLLMPDPIDEFCMQHLSEYERKKVKSIAKDDANPFEKGSNEKKKMQKLKEMYKPLTDWWKKLIGKEMESIKVSNKLVDDAAYIFTSQYGYSATMEKINRAQAFANQEKAASYMLAKKTLDINPHHPVIKELLDRVVQTDGNPDEDTAEIAKLIWNAALLNSGFIIEDPSVINTPIQSLVKMALGVKKEAQVEEIEVEIEEDEEEDEDHVIEIEPEEIEMPEPEEIKIGGGNKDEDL